MRSMVKSLLSSQAVHFETKFQDKSALIPILFVQSEMQDLLQMDPRVRRISPSGLAATVDMMEHQVDQWQGEIDWARRLRERVVAGIEANPAESSAGGAT